MAVFNVRFEKVLTHHVRVEAEDREEALHRAKEVISAGHKPEETVRYGTLISEVIPEYLDTTAA